MSKTWEEAVFWRPELQHLEVMVHALGTQTGGSMSVWSESVIPVLGVLTKGNVSDFMAARDHLLAIYTAPDEWVRVDEFDALLTEAGR